MTTEQKSKAPVIVAAAIVLALGAGGAIYLSGQKSAPTAPMAKTAVVAPATNGVEDIAPAADTTADGATTDTAAASDMIGEIKVGDPVVAKLGETAIMRSDVLNFITTLPEQVRQMPLQTLFPLALDQVVNNRIISMKADGANLENDPEVTAILEQAREQVVRNVFVERELKRAVSDKDLQDAYKTFVSSLEKVEEVRARHILVADEAEARELIKKLNEGASFEELATQSTDTGSAARGGDLGYFTKAEMVPEFSEAAFTIAPGTVGKDPVQSQFGWHVIKVEEKRQRPEPAFDMVKPQLEAQLRRERLSNMLEQWQKDAKIEKFDINGEPVNGDATSEN